MGKENASEQVERLKQENSELLVKLNLLKKRSGLSADELNAIEREAEELFTK